MRAASKPDASGAFQLVREDRSPTPNIVLAPGGYVVHASLGLVSAVRPVTLRNDTVREQFDLPAGGLRIEGRVGTTKIPQGQITFSIYKGSQFEVGERAPLAQNVAAGDVMLVPEGTYYIISNYGDGVLVDPDQGDNQLIGNIASGNFDDGLEVDEPGTFVARNVADGNADLGIEAVFGVIDGANNRADGNGDPRQCINVDCR